MIQGRVFFNKDDAFLPAENAYFKCAFIHSVPGSRLCQRGGEGLMFVGCTFVNVEAPLGSTVVDCLLLNSEVPKESELIGCYCFWDKDNPAGGFSVQAPAS